MFRPGAAKEKLTFVSCQFALILSILVIVSSGTLVVALPMFPCLYSVPPRFRLAPFALSACGEEGRASCGIPALPGKFLFLGCWAFLLLLGLRKMSATGWLVGPTSVAYFRIHLGIELGFVFGG